MADRTFTVGTQISTLMLPEATGGSGTLTYSLTPDVNSSTGLSFDAATRTLSGTPTKSDAPREYSYTATDANDDTAALSFRITVRPAIIASVTVTPGNGQATMSWTTGADDGITHWVYSYLPLSLIHI